MKKYSALDQTAICHKIRTLTIEYELEMCLEGHLN